MTERLRMCAAALDGYAKRVFESRSENTESMPGNVPV